MEIENGENQFSEKNSNPRKTLQIVRCAHYVEYSVSIEYSRITFGNDLGSGGVFSFSDREHRFPSFGADVSNNHDIVRIGGDEYLVA